MSRHRHRPEEEGIFDSAPDDRLHNSGWGRPPEQYRTAGVGTGFVLDVPGLLRAWRGAPADAAAALREVQPRHRRFPRALVARYAELLATALDPDACVPGDAFGALEALRRVVVARGLHAGITLTWFSIERYKLQIPVDRRFDPTAEQVAVALAAISLAKHPTVIWNGEPSLDALRPESVMRVRWLRRHDAAPAAAALWQSLAALGTR